MARTARKNLLPREEARLLAREQALEDVAGSGGVEVVLVRHDRPSAGDAFAGAVQERAWARGFVSSEVPLFSDRGFDAFDSLVRAIIRGLTDGRDGGAERGLPKLLDHFVQKRGARAGSLLATAIEREGAYGDLASLCLAYADAATTGPRREGKRIDDWLSGIETKSTADLATPLSPRNANRALAELTRLVRALGFRGTLLCFTGGDALAKLPDARRRGTYTVLRELVDNADGGRGLVATELLLLGGASLFEGTKSLAATGPLALRTGPPKDDGEGLVPPHRALHLDAEERLPAALPIVRPPPIAASDAIRALLRVSAGLPPLDALPELSIGYDRIDRTIEKLFEHSAMEGSVFQLLTGAYGAGKTHLLMHLSERALADRRPVLRLAVEELDADLGSPQRHLRRLLEDATLPLPGRPSMLDRLAAWTASGAATKRLMGVLKSIAVEDSDAAPIAKRALDALAEKQSPQRALHGLLGARDLESKPSQPSYRASAYARLLLWLELLHRVDDLAGPVLLIDEAENLYRGGVTRAGRRTALRSLAFYCGGALPRACVVLAITEDAHVELRQESEELLGEIEEQKTLLPWEDASLFARRLRSARAVPVPALRPSDGAELATRVRALHTRARGPVPDLEFDAWVKSATTGVWLPRTLVRGAIDRLESRWWNAR